MIKWAVYNKKKKKYLECETLDCWDPLLKNALLFRLKENAQIVIDVQVKTGKTSLGQEVLKKVNFIKSTVRLVK